jgi:hypothetical protein
VSRLSRQCGILIISQPYRLPLPLSLDLTRTCFSSSAWSVQNNLSFTLPRVVHTWNYRREVGSTVYGQAFSTHDSVQHYQHYQPEASSHVPLCTNAWQLILPYYDSTMVVRCEYSMVETSDTPADKHGVSCAQIRHSRVSSAPHNEQAVRESHVVEIQRISLFYTMLRNNVT